MDLERENYGSKFGVDWGWVEGRQAAVRRHPCLRMGKALSTKGRKIVCSTNEGMD